MPRQLDVKIGDVYGILQVVRAPEKIDGKKEKYCWCKCMNCGREKMVKASSLKDLIFGCRCTRSKNNTPKKYPKLKTVSFQDWCTQNSRQDLLDRWDYELNQYTPDVIACKSGYKIFFKCPAGQHKSKAVVLSSITNNGNKLECDECKLEESSFGRWCEIHKPHVLDLWDYGLNNASPYDITCGTHKKYYFKCSRGLHESQLKTVSKITGRGDDIICNKCNSLGQFILDHYGPNGLDTIWDYEKNNVDPFEIARCAKRYVYIKCINNSNHRSYPISCSNLTKGRGCPECKREREESKLQEKVRTYIEENYGYNIIHEYSCDIKAVNPKTNYVLPYDNQVIISNNNLIIEVHGIQHYEINSYVKLTAKKHNIAPEVELAELQWRDEYKKNYAIAQGYYYLEIPYWTEKDESYKNLIDSKIQEILTTQN